MAELDEPAVEEHPLGRDRLVPALAASLYWSGAAADWHATAPDALGWLAEIWGAGDEHVPLTLVHDLGVLLVQGHAFRLASGRDLADWPPQEQAARLGYEERVLGRWLLDGSVDAAQVALGGVPPDRREVFVAHAIRLALSDRLLQARLRLTGNAAHVRSLGGKVVAETPSRFDEWSPQDAEWLSLAADVHGAAIEALGPGPLFGPEICGNSITSRSCTASPSAWPSGSSMASPRASAPSRPPSRGRLRRTAREIPVEAEEADRFPAGGFDALSHQGRFENLVRSEVAYVGQGASGRSTPSTSAMSWASCSTTPATRARCWTRTATSRW
ncbi:MAG: hypothetical protein R3F43_19940 [bacterium]